MAADLRSGTLVVQRLVHFFHDVSSDGGPVLYALLVIALAVGFVIGRRWRPRAGGHRTFGAWRFPTFQNSGEARVSRVLLSHFGAPDYHLMNHVTVRIDDGTTQVDHILVSRFGVFVVETKDFKGWIFANEADPTWTQALFRRKFTFQNPILQNRKHVRAIQKHLDFLPAEAVKSVVVFSGDAEFKTAIPDGVITIGQLASYVAHQTEEVMSLNRVQFCVGRLETQRLALSRETDVEHVQNVVRKRGRAQ